MLERLRQALVKSFVGAIALGYLFAQGVMYFVNFLSSPLASWVARTEISAIWPSTRKAAGFWYHDALPPLARCFLVMLVWYVLMRWLYFKPIEDGSPEPGQLPEQAA